MQYKNGASDNEAIKKKIRAAIEKSGLTKKRNFRKNGCKPFDRRAVRFGEIAAGSEKFRKTVRSAARPFGGPFRPERFRQRGDSFLTRRVRSAIMISAI